MHERPGRIHEEKGAKGAASPVGAGAWTGGPGRSRRRRESGFSLVEALVVVATIGVLVGVCVVAFTDTLGAARSTVSGENLERLNGAVWNYNQIASRITVAADASTTNDETQVLALLQARDPMLPGSPFFTPGVSFPVTADATTYRMFWNGTAFQVIEPGTAGTGLLIGQ